MEHTMERLTITLTPDLAARVKSAVDAGNYGSVSEVMRQALRDWELAEARRQAELSQLRADVHVGLAQIAAGKARPFNAARIIKAGERLAAKAR
jgi:antitoxin ParD1/3/4